MVSFFLLLLFFSLKELALIKATAIAVSVTLDILGTTVLLRSTNANLCLVFTVRNSHFLFITTFEQ